MLLSLGSKMALLTSNRVMSKRLDHLLHQNTIWSKAINPFQLAFVPHETKTTRSALGVLIHNGKKKSIQEKPVVPQGKSTGVSATGLIFFSFRDKSRARPKVREVNWIIPSDTLFTSSKLPLQTTLDDESQPAILLDTSDDFCAVCRCGGELVCCDECPRVYHIECHVPSLNEISMHEKWKCGLCVEANNTSSGLKRKHDELNDPLAITTNTKLTALEKQICEKLILQMFIHPLSVPFHHPVPADVRHSLHRRTPLVEELFLVHRLS